MPVDGTHMHTLSCCMAIQVTAHYYLPLVALLRSGYGSGDPCNTEEQSHLRGSTVINVGKWGLPCLTGRLPTSLLVEIHFHVVSCGKNVKPPPFLVIGCEVPLSGATALLNKTHGLHTLLYTAGSQITQ